MGLKENFNQAMKDLLNRGGLVGSEMEEQAKSKSDLDSYLDVPQFNRTGTNSPAGATPGEPTGSASNTRVGATSGTTGFSHNYVIGDSTGGSGNAPFFDQDKAKISVSSSDTDWSAPMLDNLASSFKRSGSARPQDNEYGRMFKQADEMTVISKNTLIVGDIKTLANITVDGSVRGNIDAMKDANIHGTVIGDVRCNNSDVRGSSIQGNITSKGSTYIDSESIMLGDVTAQLASIDGKVKGNIEIGSKIELQHNAIVAGNINTNSISIEDGANIRGFINTTFLREQGDSAFPKQVSINSDGAEQ